MNNEERRITQRFKIDDRIISIVNFLVENPNHSIRKLSKEFMLSKSQIHRDIHNVKHLDDELYVQCKNIIRKHKKG